jgi:hypothetical protein
VVDGAAGKGDRYRPTDLKKFGEGWERAFGPRVRVHIDGTSTELPRRRKGRHDKRSHARTD